MLDEAAILNRLRERPDLLPPLRLRVVEEERLVRDRRPDAVVEMAWSGRSWRFAAETKRLGTPKMLRAAAVQAQRYAQSLDLRPLVVVPYLSDKQLDVLAAEQVSGIDLCGNGIVQVPGELLVYRKGEPNAYPASTPIRKVYQGASSMVARIFLLQPRYKSVVDVLDEVARRGGNVSLSTVSKVLKTLEDDLIIRRDGRSSCLIQANELLDKLAENYERPGVIQSEQFRWAVSDADPRYRVCEVGQRVDAEVVMAGGASVERYAVMPREKVTRFYCSNLTAMVEEFGEAVRPTRRFADIELLETKEPLVYFDRRLEKGMAYASPIQCWLELQAGDKREREAANQVRQRILSEADTGGGGATP